MVQSMRPIITPTGNERVLGDKEIIVSKTDLSGKITYANKKFLEIAGYREDEVMGAQHNIVRHPEMPRSIFLFLWKQLQAGHEVFAYVINLAKNGDYYWVLAHVTPSINNAGEITGYHSNRRAVDPTITKKVIAPVYASLVDVENAAISPKEGLASSYNALEAFIQDQGGNYDKWIFSL